MDLFSDEVYLELRLLARAVMRGERRNHTLSPTDLFHEAFCRVKPHLSQKVERCQDVRALFAITMRRVLIDHARKRTRRNKILPYSPVGVENSESPTQRDPDQYQLARLERLEEAFEKLAMTYPVHAKIAELRYFGGQSIESCAEIVGVSEATVQRYWSFAKAWIVGQIKRAEG